MLSITRLVLAMHYSNLQQEHTKIELNIWTAACLEFYYMATDYKHSVRSTKMYFNPLGPAKDMNFSLLQQNIQKDMKCHNNMLLIWSFSEVITAVFVRIQVFWDMTCQWPSGCWFWKASWCLHLQDKAVQEEHSCWIAWPWRRKTLRSLGTTYRTKTHIPEDLNPTYINLL